MKWMMEAAAAAAASADGWMDGLADWQSDARMMCPDSKDFCTSLTRPTAAQSVVDSFDSFDSANKFVTFQIEAPPRACTRIVF